MHKVLQDRLGVSVGRLIAAQDALLGVAPLGITVVTAGGEVAHVNAYQSTLPGCPWVENPTLDVFRDTAVPRSLRNGLRRIVDGEVSDGAIRIAPLVFRKGGPTLETWLIPVVEDGNVQAALIAQCARDAARVRYSRTARVSADAGAFAPPRLNIPKLMQVFGLTEREVQVIDALCRGEDTVAIAQAMGITPNTVKDYVKRVQGKLNVRNRLTIVTRALQVSLD